jgi:ornithine decarboxylase
MSAQPQPDLDALAPAALDALPYATPFLVLDHERAHEAYVRLRRALPRVAVHYAVKCNSDPALLARLHALGAGFEIASLPELEALVALGVHPRDVLYSNPVKPPAHIAGAWRLGVTRFAADSRGELEKLAALAPGSAVYIRLDARDATSRVPLAGRFGVDQAVALALLLEARALGLRPHGLTFHVGSQALDPAAYTRAIVLAAEVMRAAHARGIRLELLDIGGGLPARYAEPIPPLDAYGRAIAKGVAGLPYPLHVVAEPGRVLVAEAGVLATTVIGVAERRGRRWLHLDVGAFNGMMETLETRRQLVYPLAFSPRGPRRLVAAAVTGPTCDSEDTLFLDVPVPEDLRCGDRLYILTAGAYTTAYASRFNGFDVPRTYEARPVSHPGLDAEPDGGLCTEIAATDA